MVSAVELVMENQETASKSPPAGSLAPPVQSSRETINSTRSLYESDIVYEIENGRTYCGKYFMPVDEVETDRLQLVHQVYLNTCGSLTHTPLSNPTKILDVGTGRGDWAIAIADLFPDAEVIGTDIAKIQPTAVPPNVFFEIDDAEDESGWTFAENSFDLIHFRNMTGAFADWDHIYREAFAHLKPGGWIEVLDFDSYHALLAAFEPDAAIVRFFKTVAEASQKAGRPRSTKHMTSERLMAAGFEEVTIRDDEIPFGQWQNGKEKKFLGKLWLAICVLSAEALSLRLFTRELGWTAEAVRELCDQVSEDVTELIKDKERMRGCVVTLRALIARKPIEEDYDPPGLEVDDEFMSEG